MQVSLQIFFKSIITAKNNQSKIPSVAQSIMQLACPKTIIVPSQVYIELFSRYSDYVIKCYGKGTVVVFDGYNGLPTKDMAQQKRTKFVGRKILFTNDMKINFTKEEFLLSKKQTEISKRIMENVG